MSEQVHWTDVLLWDSLIFISVLSLASPLSTCILSIVFASVNLFPISTEVVLCCAALCCACWTMNVPAWLPTLDTESARSPATLWTSRQQCCPR